MAHSVRSLGFGQFGTLRAVRRHGPSREGRSTALANPIADLTSGIHPFRSNENSEYAFLPYEASLLTSFMQTLPAEDLTGIAAIQSEPIRMTECLIRRDPAASSRSICRPNQND